MAKILVVEDEKVLRDAFSILLKVNNYTVDEAANGEEALEYCRRTDYDLILLDLMMPVLDGAGFLREYSPSDRPPKTKIIVLSNLSFDKVPAELKGLGIARQEVKSNLSTKQLVEMVKAELS